MKLAFAVAALTVALLVPITSAEAPASSKQADRYEVDFLTSMIDHHHMAVMTASMCVEKAVHEELRSLCQSIVETQSQEIETMQAWLQDWYGISYEPQMTAKDHRMMDRLASLEGAQFEIEFMEMMIKHHRSAIREAQTCLQKAEHPQLIDLCQGIIDTQSAEVKQLQTWLCEWYARCQTA